MNALEDQTVASMGQNQMLYILGFGVTAHGLILWCDLYYLPFYFEAVEGYTSILAGTAFLPLTFTLCPSAITIGLLIPRWGHYR
ncbi:uncharacterized protein BO87DRAFT_429477 [Aspergillus neoniger CBS 115656]|uniref:Major facilitator superfamily (MFS) profile domain-containing protein n=1 Tax=Aspergillus neoniger (strain CBS 115656) TaxID=1448310 RepID=A0A318YR67_ASPNB|nr:hypothetical protein BO87DRAFT_429477 [Aspergillus neoniger CBS 115656]PYH30598.1 hypothetical protein BO87DRAFT_429477 [Aspergillus neoniger CBS 115656]